MTHIVHMFTKLIDTLSNQSEVLQNWVLFGVLVIPAWDRDIPGRLSIVIPADAGSDRIGPDRIRGRKGSLKH